MEENQQSQTDNQQQQENVKKDFKNLFTSIRDFLVDLLDIKEGTDKKETIQKIKDGIPVKNQTAWILVFSIIIASIGLNVSSTAVVIGAMLVSPLMGPILGIGLSIGINDIDTLKRSLKNLGVMIGLSLITSFLFFSIPFFQDATPELLSRTKPDVRDVLIAISGGLALIVALSRQKEMTNTIAGIAIATALMPPLCTAGFGLAIGNFGYFGGAMFLFIINCIFIALSTFVIVKFLRFPMVKYINSAGRKRVAQLASVVALLVFSFSIYLFAQLFLENRFQELGKKYIEALVTETGAGVIKSDPDYASKEIRIIILGKNLSSEEKVEWQNKLPEFGLDETNLVITQDEQDMALLDKVKSIEDLYVKNQKLIASKDESIQEKDQKIRELSLALEELTKEQIPFLQISREARINYDDLKSISFSKVLTTNFYEVDTIPIAIVSWNDTLSNNEMRNLRLKNWLKTRLILDTLQVREESEIFEKQ